MWFGRANGSSARPAPLRSRANAKPRSTPASATDHSMPSVGLMVSTSARSQPLELHPIHAPAQLRHVVLDLRGLLTASSCCAIPARYAYATVCETSGARHRRSCERVLDSHALDHLPIVQ